MAGWIHADDRIDADHPARYGRCDIGLSLDVCRECGQTIKLPEDKPEVYELAGADLADLRLMVNDFGTAKVTVMIDGGLKVKVNDDMWAEPIGTSVGMPHPI